MPNTYQLVYDGVTNCVNCGTATVINDRLSMEVWATPDAACNGHAILRWFGLHPPVVAGWPSFMLRFRNLNNLIEAFVTDGAFGEPGGTGQNSWIMTNGAAWTPGVWNHVVTTWFVAGGVHTWTLFVNNVQIIPLTGSAGALASLAGAAGHLMIGGYDVADPNVVPFRGRIKQARIYNRVLSPAEIGYHWAGGEGQYCENETGLVAAYNFDEGAGNATADVTGNNNGTISGCTREIGQRAIPTSSSASRLRSLLAEAGLGSIVTSPANTLENCRIALGEGPDQGSIADLFPEYLT